MSKKRRVTLEIRSPEKDEKLSCRSVRWDRPNGGGPEYPSKEINICVGKDGHISFCDDDVEDSIYFYPEQIAHLRKALSAIHAIRAERKGKS